MSANEWYGLIGLTVGIVTPLLGFLGGAIWWAASLHGLVKSIAKSLGEYMERNDKEHAELWEALHTKADKP